MSEFRCQGRKKFFPVNATGNFFVNRIFAARVKIIRKRIERSCFVMKVLLVNGSPHANGNTSIALNEMIKTFEAEGVETKYFHVGNKVVRGCMACQKCF